MQHIHELLQSKVAWYGRWHQDPHSSTVAWAIFILASLLTVSSLLNVIEGELATLVDNEVQIGTIHKAAEQVVDLAPNTATQLKLKEANDLAYSYLVEYKATPTDATYQKLSDALAERRTLLLELYKQDPKQVMHYFFGPETRKMVPDALKGLLE
jgi:hypothetical protein